MDRNTTAPPLGMLGSLVATLLFAMASPSDGTGGLGINAIGGGFNTAATNASEITGRAGLDDDPLFPWPPRSPDLTPCDFFLWGYVRDKVYVPPMSTTLQALQERITAAVTDIYGNILLNVWTELDYRWDVCRVTKGAHIEHL
ncbi:hypothetical protein AVEN_193194-1 [Araneus ventricosus]|uniref:Uncharacterized protein n=1 Tax=Araneus ventricosus TaxID=182803 RepID=A0A4Y2B2Q3_ARAVE|nr:hypothetical protein AVEN_193194-1 [Araneus ventricosus]